MKEKWPLYSNEERLISVMTHGGYFVTLLIDFTYNSVPFRKRNFLWVYIVGAMYLLLNFTLSRTYGAPVYKVMDWEGSDTAIFIGVAGLAMLVQFSIGWVLYLKFKLPRIEKR